VIDELGEDSLSGIHPSLSKIRAASGHPALAPGSAAIQFKSKNESYTLSLVICDFYRGRPDFSRTLLIGGHYLCQQKTVLKIGRRLWPRRLSGASSGDVRYGSKENV